VRLRVALYVALACLCILALDVWQSWSAHEQKRQESVRASATEARVAAQQIQDVLQITDTLLHEIAARVASHGTEPAALKELTSKLQLDADKTPQLVAILVLDTHGDPVASSLHRPLIEGNYANRDYFEYLRSHSHTGIEIAPPIQGLNAGQWVVPVALRIDEPNGRFGGVVVAGLGLAYQNQFFTDMNLGANGVVNVIRDDGTLLTRWPFQAKVLGMHLVQTVPFPASQQAKSTVLRSPVDHIKRFYGIRRVNQYPVVLSVGLASRTAFAPWYRDTTLHAIAGVLMVLAMSLFGMRLLRQITMRAHAEKSLFAANEALRRIAMHDPLTGLANRAHLNEELPRILERARRNSSQFAILFIDLDRFKRLNDTHGHAAGDDVLCEIAQRLRHCVRQGDLIGRLGGDEFLVVLQNCDRQRTADVAARMLHILYQPVTLGPKYESGFTLSASIGIAMYPRDGLEADILLRNADIAMYRAKSLNRNQVHFFEPEYEREARENLALETVLWRVLRTESLSVVYQPKVDACGTLCGAEALVRWHDDELKHIATERFIAIAEECGLIAELDAWVLNESCRQLAEWRAAGLDVPGISVNVCAVDVKNADYSDLVARTLRTHGLNASDLTLEMTERVMFSESTDDIRVALDSLHQLGVLLSIDDFGTGYSSLSYLYRFPVTELKIDRSFVRDIGVDKTAESLAQAVMNIGNVLNLRVVAEGVETLAQRDFLRAQGCSIYQGYLYSAPLPPAEFARWVAAHSQYEPPVQEGPHPFSGSEDSLAIS